MKDFILKNYYLVLILLVFCLSGAVFYVGYLYGQKDTSPAVALQCSDDVLDKLKIPVASIAKGDINSNTQKLSQGLYVGSKNGTKYYRENCATVKRIKPENYIWFKSSEDAELQGYTKGSC